MRTHEWTNMVDLNENIFGKQFVYLTKKCYLCNMIELERHIEILLLDNDCVIVPDFGGFMAHHVDARFDERDYTFIPPLRTLGFNPKLTMNDSLLAQSYVEAYDISYPEAVKRIGDEVREIRQRISHDGSYELHNIGVITINDDGNFEFEPCEAGILTPSLYGLGSFAFQSISATTEQEEPAQTPLASITDETEDNTISIRLSLLRNLAAACIAIIAFLLLPKPLDNTTTVTAGSTIDTGMLDKIMPKDVTTGTEVVKNLDVREAIKEVNAAKEAAKESGKTDAEEAKTEKTCYVIVLASRVGKKNAEAYAQTLRDKGYDEARAVTRPNGSKVVYGSYESQKQAQQALRELNGKSEFADGWVMKLSPL